uniref:Transmembrane protein n=1 Tax=Populus trichocarpa TaxID=3694 RepID=A0A2K1YE61_POPTR
MSWRGVALKSSKPTKTTRGQVWPLSQQKKKDEQEEGEMRLEADFFRGWFLIFPRFDRSYFSFFATLALSLSFFFFASNGSGSARKEGDQKLTRSLTHFPREICAVFFGRQRLLSRLPR